VGLLPRRLWVLLAPLLTAAVLLASSSSIEKLYVPSVSVEDVVAAFYLTLSLLLAIGIVSMRHELAEAIRELFRREPQEGRGRRASFFWLLVNVVLLVVAYFLTARGLEERRREIFGVLGQVANATRLENTTQAVTTQGPLQALLADGPRQVLAPYAPFAALAAVLLALLSLVLAMLERGSSPPGREEDALRESFLREASAALESLRVDADTRRVIVELYYSLCKELRRHGVRVSAENTAREIMREALRLLPDVPQEPLEALTHLFEKAAYSDHPLHDEDRGTAEQALTQIVSSLEGSPRGGRSGEG